MSLCVRKEKFRKDAHDTLTYDMCTLERRCKRLSRDGNDEFSACIVWLRYKSPEWSASLAVFSVARRETPRIAYERPFRTRYA